jgi:hypothetical protein
MIPNYRRLMRLHRKIGARLVPFSPIAPLAEGFSV